MKKKLVGWLLIVLSMSPVLFFLGVGFVRSGSGVRNRHVELGGRQTSIALHTAIMDALAVAESDWPRAIEILQEALQEAIE